MRETFELRPLLLELEEFLKPQTQVKSLTLHMNINRAPSTVYTDRNKLRQILLNLLGNAVKFTHTGSVTLRASGEDPTVTFSVIDTGIGIAPDHLAQIFEAFKQLESSDSREHQGTGLGLAISNRYAALLGGAIEVESTLGQGSTFTVKLPSQGKILARLADPGRERSA